MCQENANHEQETTKKKKKVMQETTHHLWYSEKTSNDGRIVSDT